MSSDECEGVGYHSIIVCTSTDEVHQMLYLNTIIIKATVTQINHVRVQSTSCAQYSPN